VPVDSLEAMADRDHHSVIAHDGVHIEQLSQKIHNLVTDCSGKATAGRMVEVAELCSVLIRLCRSILNEPFQNQWRHTALLSPYLCVGSQEFAVHLRLQSVCAFRVATLCSTQEWFAAPVFLCL